jgi:hypothetical protein
MRRYCVNSNADLDEKATNLALNEVDVCHRSIELRRTRWTRRSVNSACRLIRSGIGRRTAEARPVVINALPLAGGDAAASRRAKRPLDAFTARPASTRSSGFGVDWAKGRTSVRQGMAVRCHSIVSVGGIAVRYRSRVILSGIRRRASPGARRQQNGRDSNSCVTRPPLSHLRLLFDEVIPTQLENSVGRTPRGAASTDLRYRYGPG